MSSIWKDLHLNPRVESCFTCLRRASSFLCTFNVLGFQPPNDVASLLFSFVLDCHLELTFQYDRICQLRALAHRVQKVFWEEWESYPRTHSCTRILDWGFSWVAPQTARPSCLVIDDNFFLLRPFNRVTFWFQRFNLLHSSRHPFLKICV